MLKGIKSKHNVICEQSPYKHRNNCYKGSWVNMQWEHVKHMSIQGIDRVFSRGLWLHGKLYSLDGCAGSGHHTEKETPLQKHGWVEGQGKQFN